MILVDLFHTTDCQENGRIARDKFELPSINVHRLTTFTQSQEPTTRSTRSYGYDSKSDASSSSLTVPLRREALPLQNSGRSSPVLDGRGRKLSLRSPRRCLGASPTAAAVTAIIPYTEVTVSSLAKSVTLHGGDGGRGAPVVVVGTVGKGREGKSRPRSLGCRPVSVGLAGLLLLLLSFSDLGNALYTRGGVLGPTTVKGSLARAAN